MVTFISRYLFFSTYSQLVRNCFGGNSTIVVPIIVAQSDGTARRKQANPPTGGWQSDTQVYVYYINSVMVIPM